ncbi:MAG: hypothetical protein LBU95_01625 [Rikenellaceae bacterium]|jgi:hypothetical protein|nr:hypothetical protein [Rikenellaceae bacterium]
MADCRMHLVYCTGAFTYQGTNARDYRLELDMKPGWNPVLEYTTPDGVIWTAAI